MHFRYTLYKYLGSGCVRGDSGKQNKNWRNAHENVRLRQYKYVEMNITKRKARRLNGRRIESVCNGDSCLLERRRVVWQKHTDVSQVPCASIIIKGAWRPDMTGGSTDSSGCASISSAQVRTARRLAVPSQYICTSRTSLYLFTPQSLHVPVVQIIITDIILFKLFQWNSLYILISSNVTCKLVFKLPTRHWRQERDLFETQPQRNNHVTPHYDKLSCFLRHHSCRHVSRVRIISTYLQWE